MRTSSWRRTPRALSRGSPSAATTPPCARTRPPSGACRPSHRQPVGHRFCTLFTYIKHRHTYVHGWYRYFHKATKMDHRFAPAWIGFGNAFAAQDESDQVNMTTCCWSTPRPFSPTIIHYPSHTQAMSAYRTAARLFPASHVPLLYMGMEYLRTNNLALAAHFLQVGGGRKTDRRSSPCTDTHEPRSFTLSQAAKDLNAADPLVHNELGAVLFLLVRTRLRMDQDERTADSPYLSTQHSGPVRGGGGVLQARARPLPGLRHPGT